MAWYLRKSVSLGPVRFNLSKSGIGTSVGVKGFRIGVRPDGRSYVHAGRYGLYYRQELGNINSKTVDAIISPEIRENYPTDITTYNSIASQDLVSEAKKDLLFQLNRSYSSFRFDYFVAIISFIAILFLWGIGDIIRILAIVLGIFSTIIVAIWESKRRTINIYYEFENDISSQFEMIISAFNNIAENNRIWSLIDSRYLYNAHESKLNSGASSIVNRESASAGEGKPPWVKTNISIPAIKMNGRSLYFIPDGILVYDQSGVGIVAYKDLKIEYHTTRFIEENPPRDSEIVDYTWRYPNKNGGPDRRFNNNYQIPICLYGELKIFTEKGLLLYIMTSRHITPEKYYKAMGNLK